MKNIAILAALFCLCLAVPGQQVDKPAGGIPQTPPTTDFSFLVSTGTVARSTRLMNASNTLESLVLLPGWGTHVSGGVILSGQVVKGLSSSTTVIGPAAIGSTNLALQSVDSSNIVALTITSNQLADSTLGTNKFSLGALQYLQSLLSLAKAYTDAATNSLGTSGRLVPALPSDATKFLDGTGAFTIPPGTGGSLNATNSGFYITSAGTKAFNVYLTNGFLVFSISNDVITFNTNVVFNSTATFLGTNLDAVSNLLVTGWALLKGAETNSSITGPGLLGIDVNGKRSAVTVGSGLTLSAGTLTSSGTSYSNITENGYTVIVRSNIVVSALLMTSNQNGTVSMTNGSISLTGTNGQPGQWSMYDGATNRTFFFDGTNLFASLIFTNAASSNWMTIQVTTTNTIISNIGTNGGGGFLTNTFHLGNGVTSNEFRFFNASGQLVMAVQTNGAVQIGTNNQTTINASGNLSVPNLKSPTNAPTVGQMINATSTAGDTAWSNAPAASLGYSNITENGYTVIVRSNMVVSALLMSSNQNGTVSMTNGTIAITGTNGQPGNWSMYNGATNRTFFFNGTNLSTILMTESNAPAFWPAAPLSPGAFALVCSNGFPYILLSTNGNSGGSAAWTGTNKFGW
jgi:hypothetical protein